MEANAKCPGEEIITHSAAETATVAAAWAKRFQTFGPVGAIILDGPLGAGKTAWVRGFGAGWGCTTEIASPSFALVREYHGGPRPLYHLDFYRLGSVEEVWALGWEDLLATGWVLVEWGARFAEVFPDATWGVRLLPLGPTTRRLQIGPWSAQPPLEQKP